MTFALTTFRAPFMNILIRANFVNLCLDWRSKYKYNHMHYFIITGKQTCYSGWKAEYTGFLMTAHITENNNNYVCVDKNAESIDSDTSNKNGALFYGVRTTCGSLRCPPYINHTVMMCVVCTT
jgi:hypothetical protein